MKFLGTADYSNLAKDMKKAAEFGLKGVLEDLVQAYEYDQEKVNNLSFQFYVSHTDKTIFKGSKTKFTKAYEKSVVAVIESGVINFEELGFMMYLSSKFTNHEDNYLRIDGEIVGKNEIVRYMINDTEIGLSESSIMRKFKSIEKKNYLLIDNHPDDVKKKSYYLTPFLFYKGKYMDNKTRKNLMQTYREMHKVLVEKVNKGEIDMELNPSFDKMSDEDILLFIHKL